MVSNSDIASDVVNARVAAIGASLLCLAWIVKQVQIRRRLSDIPTAPNAHWLWGNEKDVFFTTVGAMYSQWFHALGKVYKIKGAMIKPDVLVIGDPQALAHILQKRIYDYPHSEVTQNRIGRILGKSLGWVEGESEHRRMRALVAPALTLESVRAGAPDIFAAMSTMENRLTDHVRNAGGTSTISIMDWVSAATMDIIGRYGFGHDFGGGRDPMAQEIIDIWRRMSMVSTSPKGWNAIMVFRLFPFIDKLPLKAIKAQAAVREVLQAGIAKEIAERHSKDTHNPKGRDLLSRLMSAHHEGRIDEEELITHISFFIMVGFETTAQVIGHAIWQLARHPNIQDELRQEVSSLPGATFDELSTKMPLLDAVLKESLRLSPSIPYVERVAAEDDVLPLSEPIISPSGKTLTHIVVKKGQAVQLPYAAINRLAWTNPDEFDPSRWMDDSKRPSADHLPRGWSGILSFGDGARNCQGYRLALFESKAIIASLIGNFSFHDTGAHIDWKVAASVQGYIRGREEEGPQLPVEVRLL